MIFSFSEDFHFCFPRRGVQINAKCKINNERNQSVYSVANVAGQPFEFRRRFEWFEPYADAVCTHTLCSRTTISMVNLCQTCHVVVVVREQKVRHPFCFVCCSRRRPVLSEFSLSLFLIHLHFSAWFCFHFRVVHSENEYSVRMTAKCRLRVVVYALQSAKGFSHSTRGRRQVDGVWTQEQVMTQPTAFG